MFLFEYEWNTYKRRKPVRYIRKPYTNICEICGQSPYKENPFQNAHKIGFHFGILELALTPDFLDSDQNIVTAHRKICNKKAELNLHDALCFLKELGCKRLPSFLPHKTKTMWNNIFTENIDKAL